MTPLRLSVWVLATAWLGASCTDRVRMRSELGRELALHLCPIQAGCGCEDELLIPDCEVRVEQEFAETEARALEAGLVFDRGCFDRALERIDRLDRCERVYDEEGLPCPVYTAHADVGEACEIYDFVPKMTECRAGLHCIQGKCRDLDNPHLLYEGEICSDTQSHVATGDLGRCADGLVCDSDDTRTCVINQFWPPVPTGESCPGPGSCVPESYCRPQPGDEFALPDRPGVCMIRTPEGEPCELFNECTAQCIDGRCEVLPPNLCEWLESWWWREVVVEEG